MYTRIWRSIFIVELVKIGTRMVMLTRCCVSNNAKDKFASNEGEEEEGKENVEK